MNKQILVKDENDNKVGMTFERRAKQLVGKGRAVWMDEQETVICLVEPEFKEEKRMFKNNNGNQEEFLEKPRGYSVVDESKIYADDDLYEIAKKNVERRFSILINWVVFFVAQLLVGAVTNNTFNFIRDIILFADLLWFLGLCLFTVYMFLRVTPAKVQREYRKLRRKL